MNFNFDYIESGKIGGQPLPENTIRVSRKIVSLSASLMSRYRVEPTASGLKRARVQIGVDNVNQAIQLKHAPLGTDGFSVTSNLYATSGTLTMPTNLRKNPPVVGDYVETEPGSNIFVLAK